MKLHWIALAIVFQLAPLSTLTCHMAVGGKLPFAVALNVAGSEEFTVIDAGSSKIDTGSNMPMVRTTLLPKSETYRFAS